MRRYLPIAAVLAVLVAGLALLNQFNGTRRPVPASPNPGGGPAGAGPTTVDAAAPPSNHQPPTGITPAAAIPPRPSPPDPEAAFARFSEWTRRLAAEAPDAASLAAGIDLARERNRAMQSLIRTNPALAVESALPWSERTQLPPAILAEIEEPVSFNGDLEVLAAIGGDREQETDGFRPIRRTVRAGGRSFDAYVSGAWNQAPTLRNIPLRGVAAGGLLAVAENPVRRFARGEPVPSPANAIADPVCGISGKKAIADAEAAVQVGAEVHRFCAPSHADQFASTNGCGAHRFMAYGGLNYGPLGTAPTPHTSGQKRLLYIRVRFPDLTNDPLHWVSASNSLRYSSGFFATNSHYAVTGFDFDITPTFLMPKPTSQYNTNAYPDDAVHADAEAAATAAGYVLTNYYCYIVRFSGIAVSYLGAALVGGPWVRLAVNHQSVLDHELGHTFGVFHANRWRGLYNYPTGPGGNVEYGNYFDVMGRADSLRGGHMNIAFKNQLGWLPETNLTWVTTNGIYRIHAHDLVTNLNGGLSYGILIRKDSERIYWGEFRQHPGVTTNYSQLNQSLIVMFGYNRHGNGGTQIIDTETAGDGGWDAPLPVGRTFADRAAGIYLTPLARGTNTSPPGNYLDVQVTLGDSPGNLSPSVSLAVSATNVAPGAPVTFTVSGSDPDGDTLAYYWDFSDRSRTTNAPVVTKVWTNAGVYAVHCEVSDQRGGRRVLDQVIVVGTPTNPVVTGRLLISGAPVPGAWVWSTSHSNYFTFTDTNGDYTLAGLPKGTHRLVAGYAQYSLSALQLQVVLGGTQQVVVANSNIAGVNFNTNALAYFGLPGFSLVLLTNGIAFTNGQSLRVTCQGGDSDGFVDRVEWFSQSTNLLGTVRYLDNGTLDRFSSNLTFNIPGVQAITAVVVDDLRNRVTSAPINVVVITTPPSNNAFASAAALSDTNGYHVSYNTFASAEPGEPAHNGQPAGASMWHRWTAPFSGYVEFTLGGGITNGTLVAYSGGSLGSLVPLAAHTSGLLTAGRIGFTAVAGTSYYIVVTSPTATAGGYQLNWIRNQPPTLNLTTTPTSGSSVNQTPATWQVSCTTADPDAGGSVRRLRMYLNNVLWTDRQSGAMTVNLTFINIPWGTYNLLMVATDNTGSTNVASAVLYVAPGNDRLSNAWVTVTGVTNGHNQGATLETGETLPGGVGGGHSVWFKFTPTYSNLFVASLAGGSVPVVGVWTNQGAAPVVTSLAPAGNGSATATSVPFIGRPGSTYFIQVDQADGSTTTNYALTVTTQAPLCVGEFAESASGAVSVTAVNCDAGQPYAVEISTDLVNWTTLTNVISGPDGRVIFSDPAATNLTQRLYRFRRQ